MKSLVRLFTLINFVLICQPCFTFLKNFLWVMIIDDTVFTIAWIFLLLYFATFIIAIWMFTMMKAGLWE